MSPSERRQHDRTYSPSITLLALYCAVILAVALLFNFWPDKVAIYTKVQDTWTSSPLLAPPFSRYLPALNVLWGLSILLHMAKMIYRRETVLMLGASLALQAYTAVLVGILEIRAEVVFAPFAATWMARLLTALCLAMGFSLLNRVRRLSHVEAVSFTWEDAEMDRV